MSIVVKVLIALSCIAFILAVIGSLFGVNLLSSPEAQSRAANNLALIAIALAIVFKKEGDSKSD